MSNQNTKGQTEKHTEVEGYITADLGLGLNLNLNPLDGGSNIGVSGGADSLPGPSSDVIEQLAKLKLA